MNIYEIYFSPTGGTQKVLRLISQAWPGQPYEMDCSVPGRNGSAFSFTEKDLCLVGVPSFGGRVPGVALEHLRRMKADHTPTVIVAAFGNRDYDDTLLELRDNLQQNGFRVIAAIAAVTEHSILRQFGAGRPDENDARELRGYGEQIRRALERGEPLSGEVAVKGNTPYRDYAGLPMKPTADKTCTRCGTCVKLCPAQAIPPEQPNQTEKELCITCMRCVSLCPQHARKLNAAMLFAAGQKMRKSCSAPKQNELFFAVSSDS